MLTTITSILLLTQTCKDSTIQCVEYYSTTTSAYIINEDSCKQDLVETSALFSIQIRKPVSLKRRQNRCQKLKRHLQKSLNWALPLEESCKLGENGVVTLSVWLNKVSHQQVSVPYYVNQILCAHTLKILLSEFLIVALLFRCVKWLVMNYM